MSTLWVFGKNTVSRIWDVAFYNLSRDQDVALTYPKHVSILWGIVYAVLLLQLAVPRLQLTVPDLQLIPQLDHLFIFLEGERNRSKAVIRCHT